MSRRKSNRTVCPWMSANLDGKERRFLQLGYSLFQSETYQQLSDGAKYLYACMGMECCGRREFIFPQAVAKRYGIAPSSLRRHIRELERRGFLRVYSMKNLRQPNRYAFDFTWKSPSAGVPTHGNMYKSDPI